MSLADHGFALAAEPSPLDRGRWFIQLAPDEPIAAQGDARVLYTVRSGWLCRSRLLRDGRRQILELVLPGERLPYDASTAAPDDTLTALSRCEVARASYATLQDADGADLFEAEAAAAERRRMAILEEQLLSLGRRSALERVAHHFCEITLRATGEVSGGGCDYPLTQTDMSDVLGLSTVHTNRMLQQLRRMELAFATRGRLVITDTPALIALAEFSPGYLG